MKLRNKFSRALIAASLLGAATVPVPLFADSSVWKVSKGAAHVFVGGTLHVLSQQDYPLPAEFAEAYAAADLVVFETDMVRIADPQFQQKMMADSTYSDGTTVRDTLKPGTIEALENHFRERAMPLDQFARFKPPMLSILITMVELQLLGINQDGVDAHFSARSMEDGKAQLALESPEQQMAMIATMGGDNPDRLIRHTLQDASELRSIMTEMVTAWRQGNVDKLDTGLIQRMRDDYPGIYQSLLVTRNVNWMPAILQLFDTDDIEFVMVGAAHLVGEDGLLEMLKKKGFTVTPL